MTELLRLGAVARLDDETSECGHARRLGESGKDRALVEPEEADDMLAEHRRGEWRIVRLELFADLLHDGDRVQRVDSVHLHGVWFRVPHGDENVRHAREVTDQSLELLHAHLARAGYDLSVDQLERVQFVLELDEPLRWALGER